MNGGWEVGPVELATTMGPQIVPAWVFGEFALDRRTKGRVSGWAVTHRKTGMAVSVIVEPLIIAQTFVEDLSELGDWSFTDPSKCKRYSVGTKSLISVLDHSGVAGWEAAI